jgi:hypothetical protein
VRWQDAVLSVGSLLFTAALIPTIRGSTKPAFLTALVTSAVLTTFVVVYVTLSLWFAAATTALGAACWALLTWQTRGQRRVTS